MKQLTSYNVRIHAKLFVCVLCAFRKYFPLKILELRAVLSPVEKSGCSIAVSFYDVVVSLCSSTQQSKLHAGLMRCCGNFW